MLWQKEILLSTFVTIFSNVSAAEALENNYMWERVIPQHNQQDRLDCQA